MHQDQPKNLALLRQIILDNGRRPLKLQAEALEIPLSTAYRLVTTYQRAGFLCAADRGHFVAGLDLADMLSGIDRHSILAAAARPHLRRLARQLRQTVHLGVLESDMVTYLLKERGGGPKVFTQAGMQLEAYCSAIGKMLLAYLPEDERERYITAAPFVALTSRTITDPAQLRSALAAIRQIGYAVDDLEIADTLWCVAVPVRDRRGRTIAAISMSRTVEQNDNRPAPDTLDALRSCASRIETSL